MKLIRSLIFAVLFPSLVFGQATGIAISTNGTTTNTSSASRDLDSATKWVTHGFLSPVSKTVTEICTFEDTKTNAPDNNDGVIELYSDKPGYPNTSLLNGTFDASTTGVKCITGLSQAVVSGTQYWLVFKNAALLPGTNYFSIFNTPDNFAGLGGSGYSSSDMRLGMTVRQTANSGTDLWNAGSERAGAGNYRIKFSDNTYYGSIATGFQYAGTPIDAADRIYSTNEVGNKFTTPANADMKVAGVAFLSTIAAGTPTGLLRFRLYAGTTLVATTASLGAVPIASMSNSWIPLYFTTPQTLTGNTMYRLVIGESAQSDTSSNAYGPARVDWDTDANSLNIKPFNGTMTKTVCTGSCSGGTWTDTPGSFYQMALILSFGDEYAVTSGGAGGLINENQVSGGMQ